MKSIFTLVLIFSFSSAFAHQVYFTKSSLFANKIVYFTNSPVAASKIIMFTKNPLAAYDCIIYKTESAAFADAQWKETTNPLLGEHMFVTENPLIVSKGCF
ncbi:hypothetical protein [Peredibacter starrii]|uniref:Uncharacterized protein n=1 Tax=Peredibacter starrii TaxID=28202 RepID=A0AAX4HRU4_9BACT|nr:hypothetical protein [Peredibacter starrii]WPU66085.1 hypothetical protein SOO65_04935 [Peredibacter starrii]